MACKYIGKCSFYDRFSTKQSLLWKAMIKNYCEGGAVCERQQQEYDDFVKLPATLMPSGAHASKAFLSLL